MSTIVSVAPLYILGFPATSKAGKLRPVVSVVPALIQGEQDTNDQSAANPLKLVPAPADGETKSGSEFILLV